MQLQIAFTSIVYPSLVLAYMGQAAYLSKHHDFESDYRIGFYVSVPGTTSSCHSSKVLRIFILIEFPLMDYILCF